MAKDCQANRTEKLQLAEELGVSLRVFRQYWKAIKAKVGERGFSRLTEHIGSESALRLQMTN